jgi:hypothetical protein
MQLAESDPENQNFAVHDPLQLVLTISRRRSLECAPSSEGGDGRGLRAKDAVPERYAPGAHACGQLGDGVVDLAQGPPTLRSDHEDGFPNTDGGARRVAQRVAKRVEDGNSLGRSLFANKHSDTGTLGGHHLKGLRRERKHEVSGRGYVVVLQGSAWLRRNVSFTDLIETMGFIMGTESRSLCSDASIAITCNFDESISSSVDLNLKPN